MSGTPVAAKRRLRRALSALRRAVPAHRREAAGLAVAQHLISCPCVVRARRVALYAALPDELPTRALFDALKKADLPRLLPRLRDDRLEFAPVEDWEALVVGRFGVREPAVERSAVALGEGDVVVVPGLAFDLMGNRLGRGRGYYDRTFAPSEAAGPLLIGACFAGQLVAEVPTDSRDRRVDAIVTERGLRWITRSP